MPIFSFADIQNPLLRRDAHILRAAGVHGSDVWSVDNIRYGVGNSYLRTFFIDPSGSSCTLQLPSTPQEGEEVEVYVFYSNQYNLEAGTVTITSYHGWNKIFHGPVDAGYVELPARHPFVYHGSEGLEISGMRLRARNLEVWDEYTNAYVVETCWVASAIQAQVYG